MVAQVIAMVGGEDDDRAVQKPVAPQRVDYLSDLVVYLFYQTGVVGPHVQHLVLGVGRQIHAHARA